jgi:hypothetical protein
VKKASLEAFTHSLAMSASVWTHRRLVDASSILMNLDAKGDLE